MALPRYIVHKVGWVGGNPIPDDEPCFVIRGQDLLALKMIDAYINLLYETPDKVDEGVVEDLLAHQLRIAEWQYCHRDQVKFADR